MSNESCKEEGPGCVGEVFGCESEASEKIPCMIQGHQDHNHAAKQVHTG
jgi:hypothetical protein